jgi:hypothetical protein
MMKTNLKMMWIACIALSMGFASCSSNDEPEVITGNGVESGDPTYVTVTLNFPKAGTSQLRATSDPNATEAEAKINTVDVFIYTAKGGYYLSHTTLTAGDFTQVSSGDTSDKYTLNSTTKIETTTGERQVFVGVNLPADVATALEHKGTSELTQVVKILTRAQLVSTTGIAMTSTELVDCIFVVDANNAANKPEVTVQRMVAKVTVQKSRNPEMVQAGVKGTLGSLSFAINNYNERSFLIQGAAPDYKDPNWDTYTPSEFSQVNKNNDYYRLVNEKEDSNADVLRNALYAAENTAQTHTKKEITRATIRATFIPDTITTDSNGTKATAVSAGITSPRTFWAVTIYNPNPEMKFFYTNGTTSGASIAGAYKTAIEAKGITTGDVVEYTDGLCYWDMFLNKEAKNKNNVWDVIRNDYYRSVITRIVAPGRPSEEIPNDEKEDEPSTETNITVQVDVLDWTPVPGNYELEP